MLNDTSITFVFLLFSSFYLLPKSSYPAFLYSTFQSHFPSSVFLSLTLAIKATLSTYSSNHLSVTVSYNLLYIFSMHLIANKALHCFTPNPITSFPFPFHPHLLSYHEHVVCDLSFIHMLKRSSYTCCLFLSIVSHYLHTSTYMIIV
jgi:hypothetical protein